MSPDIIPDIYKKFNNNVSLNTSSIPVTTSVVCLLQAGIYFLFADKYVNYGMIKSIPITEFYRIITFAWFHVSRTHLFYNLSSLIALGGLLERKMGSVQFGYVLVLFNILSGILTFFYQNLFGDSSAVIIGFSGIIFALVVIEASEDPWAKRSVFFDLITVTGKLYPWVLLVVAYIMVESSFMGHLIGVIVGTMFIWRWMDWMLLSSANIRSIENSLPVSITRRRLFIDHRKDQRRMRIFPFKAPFLYLFTLLFGDGLFSKTSVSPNFPSHSTERQEIGEKKEKEQELPIQEQEKEQEEMEEQVQEQKDPERERNVREARLQYFEEKHKASLKSFKPKKKTILSESILRPSHVPFQGAGWRTRE